ncbi:hypothetical protein Dda_8241 [Drechslerella dactyloides]|uniref:Uncharacterized protein n=1 Tax=Drechslerella dactyloides TaxID=74499 RepID=A0AAD6IVV5_DREDA|nr:hypothetical protein Dda_8241 [Drechslerella dactyloides]
MQLQAFRHEHKFASAASANAEGQAEMPKMSQARKSRGGLHLRRLALVPSELQDILFPLGHEMRPANPLEGWIAGEAPRSFVRHGSIRVSKRGRGGDREPKNQLSPIPRVQQPMH